MSFKKTISFLLYKSIAVHLPSSKAKISLGSKTIRKVLVKNFIKEMGENVEIQKGAYFTTDLVIGCNSYVGFDCRIYGPVTVGNNVMIGPEVMILTRNHRHDSTDIPIKEQGNEEFKKVEIKDDVWIGARAIILPGIKVGEGSIIGAGAVVTKSVEPYTIVAGNPARIVKRRKDTECLQKVGYTG